MKQILSFILLFSTSFVFSQNIEFAVIVKDIQTGLPISEVTITALKTKQGFLTNKNGEANISLSKESDLQFENSAYKTYTAKPLDLDKKINEVYLESNAKRLEEVILTSDHPQEILKKLVRNSQNKITIPVNLKVYLREFYKKNDQVVFFNDGLINFQIAGSLKNMKTDILVEQNRAVGLLDTDLNEDLLGYNLNDIIENYYQFQYLEELLEPSAKRKYDFQIKSYPNNENYLLIKVTPLEEISGVLSEFTIVYHNSKMIIIEVSSMVPDSRLEDLRQSFLKSSKIYKLEFKNTFRLDNDFYYLANSKEVIGFEKKYKDENRRIEVNNHMIITNFDKKMFKYNDENVFKEQSLINKKTSFFTDYWDFESGFLPTKEEKDIIERLSHL
ncbi:hypothetical protein NTJ12_001745 [Flavobacterium psychrophilum]|nr:hypothetical protein [Flavobacterium psychrophilum]